MAAAADVDKDKFLKTLTNLSEKCHLFTQTFCAKRPRYLNSKSVLEKQKMNFTKFKQFYGHELREGDDN